MLPRWMSNFSKMKWNGLLNLSVEDAYKLDDVRDALKRGDIEAATKLARVFSLQSVAAPPGNA